jgi:hypothetical protein
MHFPEFKSSCNQNPFRQNLEWSKFLHVSLLGHSYSKTSEVVMLAEKPWLTYQMDTLH